MEEPFDALDRELRETLAGEFRRTAEEDEHAARKALLRARTLSQVAHELMSRGDRVEARVGSRAFSGIVRHARGTLATVVTPSGELAHLNLDAALVIHVAERVSEGGRSAERYGPDSFIARLRELELDETKVELVVPAGSDSIVGVIDAVAADHLVAVDGDGHEWFVPLGQVAVALVR